MSTHKRKLEDDNTEQNEFHKAKSSVVIPTAASDSDESSDDDVGPSLALATGRSHVGIPEPSESASIPTTTTSSSPEIPSSSSSSSTSSSSSSTSSSSQPKRQVLIVQHEATYLNALPSAELYEKSYMHRDSVTHAIWTVNTEYLVTGSCDGVVKFWKKVPGGIEFAKAFRAHLSAVVALAASPDGLRLASVGEDHTIKFFDVVNFDMVEMIRLSFSPSVAVTWCYSDASSKPYLAVADRHSSAVYVFNTDRANEPPEHIIRLHSSPVVAMSYTRVKNMVVSVDAKGMIEYWSTDDSRGYRPPPHYSVSSSSSSSSSASATGAATSISSAVKGGALLPTTTFTSKLDTDLFALAKTKALPYSIALSPDGKQFVVTSDDGMVRLFDLASGKLIHVYDESINHYKEVISRLVSSTPETLAAGNAAQASDDDDDFIGADMKLVSAIALSDLSKRCTLEGEVISSISGAIREVITPPKPVTAGPAMPSAPSTTPASSSSSSSSSDTDQIYRSPPPNAIFDETGIFVLYPTLAGIKVVNTVSHKTVGILGRLESTERFLGIALYQGVPTVSSQIALARGITSSTTSSSSSSTSTSSSVSMADNSGAGNDIRPLDPTLVCCSFRRQRFFLFTRREPAEDDHIQHRRGGVVGGNTRDAQNEPPSARDMAMAAKAAQLQQRAKLGNSAILHTSKGDITVQLFPDATPLAVENFCELARRAYYDKTTFHRVIKSFMLQAGDPKGDGTGGTSIWNRDFKDEIDSKARKFDRPGVLAMANAGPNTNGSQFFITTVPTPWLDGKHTIFGRVTKGMDVVKAIETSKVDKHDKPIETIQLLGVSVTQ